MLALAEIQADELLADREEHGGRERAGHDIAPAEMHVRQEAEQESKQARSSQ
jgi:hypothetical protein